MTFKRALPHTDYLMKNPDQNFIRIGIDLKKHYRNELDKQCILKRNRRLYQEEDNINQYQSKKDQEHSALLSDINHCQSQILPSVNNPINHKSHNHSQIYYQQYDNLYRLDQMQKENIQRKKDNFKILQLNDISYALYHKTKQKQMIQEENKRYLDYKPPNHQFYNIFPVKRNNCNSNMFNKYQFPLFEDSTCNEANQNSQRQYESPIINNPKPVCFSTNLFKTDQKHCSYKKIISIGKDILQMINHINPKREGYEYLGGHKLLENSNNQMSIRNYNRDQSRHVSRKRYYYSQD